MALKIVFMGTPDFAVPSLKILVDNGYQVVGVITSTDKMGGRGGKKLLESPIKKYAVSQGIKVLQPKNLKAEAFIQELSTLDADLQVVVAFRMLPEVVWNMPPKGTINLHGSLLPRYRGAAPINWAVINGDKETGVTSFKLKHKIDTGDMIFQEALTIGADESTGEVHDRMMYLGAEVVLKTVQAIENDAVDYQVQDESQVSKAPKIHHDTCQINFDQSSEVVHNFVRGMSPYPTAWTYLEEGKLKVFKVKPVLASHSYKPGAIMTDERNYIRFATNDGYVEVLDLQLQGRKRMEIKSFLNGYDFDR